MQQLENCDLEK